MRLTLIDETRYAEEMDDVVVPALAACCDEGWMEPAQRPGLPELDDPGRLHYLCYDAGRFDALREDGATATFRGTIVLSYGFTEFAQKYSEMIWYFLLSGYSVCVLEHRGHGHSARDVDDPGVVWIDDWRRYAVDLAKFADTVAREHADGSPLYLYGHSMGGGVGAAVLEQYPSLFDKAVLSSPMIAPITAFIPNGVAAALAELACGLGFGKLPVAGQTAFCEDLDLTDYREASEPRVRWYHRQRCADPACRTNMPSYNWVREALRLSRSVLRPESCANVETPMLICQSGHDIWVRNRPQETFAARVREGGGDVRLRRFPESLHEIFSMPNDTLGRYLDCVLDFLDEPVLAAGAEDDVD